MLSRRGCAGGFAYRIGDRHYIDGGYRINAENADLATGYDWRLSLPVGRAPLLPRGVAVRLGYQVDDLSGAAAPSTQRCRHRKTSGSSAPTRPTSPA